TPTPTRAPQPSLAATRPPTPTLRPSPTPTPNLWPLARQEMARIALYNAVGEPGLACRTAAYLRTYGFWVVYTGNAADYRERTAIVNTANKPATLALLQQMLGVAEGEVIHTTALPDSGVDAEIAVYLGADWAADNPLPERVEGCP
ncbi:MAG: LytR C-terminal domain-containing protein, partial [Chloroflexi bacterium]|nr:LytR C-terminal domain-containing protein [Chloroflexota bacterium]